MEQLQLAIQGNTVTVPYQSIKEIFLTEDDLANWCQLHNLQYTYIAEKQSYKISKN